MKIRQFYGVIAAALLCAACSGSSGTSSSSSTGTTGTSAEADTAATQASTNTALSSVTNSTVSTVQSQTTGQVATLVKARHAVKSLSATQSESYSYDFTDDCGDSGSYALTGDEEISWDDDTGDFSFNGTLTEEYTDCTDTFEFEVEDGFCQFTTSLDGVLDMDMDANYTASDESFDMTFGIVTDGPFTVAINDDSHEVEMDITMTYADGQDSPTLTGTISIDGDEFDASQDIDTSGYTSDEIGCTLTDGSSSDDANTFDNAEDTGSAAAAADTVEGAGNLSTEALQSNTEAASLVNAELTRRYLAAPSEQNVAVSFDDISLDCPDSGSMDFSGSIDAASTSTDITLSGDLALGFNACGASATIVASDGSCDFTVQMDGTIDVAYDYTAQLSDPTTTFDLTIGWTTAEPITLVINDHSHDLEFDLSYSVSGGDTSTTATGTITIDDLSVDPSEPVDTSSFTMEELGCSSSL